MNFPAPCSVLGLGLLRCGLWLLGFEGFGFWLFMVSCVGLKTDPGQSSLMLKHSTIRLTILCWFRV